MLKFEEIEEVLQFCGSQEEEAGSDPILSKEDLMNWFKGTGIEIRTRNMVYLPPHLINLFSKNVGRKMIEFTDSTASLIPILRENGGIMIIDGQKKPRGHTGSSDKPSEMS